MTGNESVNRLKVGIAGYGVVGKRRKACIDRHPHMKVVAVCDRTFEDEGVFPDGVTYFRSYPRLLEESLDVLIVCLTNDVAAEATIAGLESGLHVFCEKPPGRDLEDIARVIRCERRCPGLKLMYGFNHRHHESVQEALQLIRSEQLGRIINMRGVYGKSKLIPLTNQTGGRGGNWLAEACCSIREFIWSTSCDCLPASSPRFIASFPTVIGATMSKTTPTR